jgi:hypothetical protein
MFTSLTTPTGREINVSVSVDWTLGAALYRIAELDGTITLGWSSGHYIHDCCETPSIEVTYGKPTASPFTHHYEDAPSVFGILLADTAVFHASDMTPDGSGRWLAVRRDTGSYYAPDVPDGTRRRTAEIVYAITTHFLAQPWTDELHRAHDHHHARSRLSEHRSAVGSLEDRISELNAVLAGQRAGVEAQEAIISAGPVSPRRQRSDGLTASGGLLAA